MRNLNPSFALMVMLTVAGAIAAAEIDATAIAEVRSGLRKEAKASWWGFDPDDSTAALQAAIDSGVPKLIVDNVGKPWIVDKMLLASNQEIVFEKGVIVQAKRGAFKGTGDCLFTCALQHDVKLVGYGATFRMWKQDYQGPDYRQAEWRHCLSIRSSKNIQVRGLTLAQSGGDGIYLGVSKAGVTNENVHIKDVVCDSNHRQGISVISAKNLLIENTVMRNTAGTPPMAGIDFEPNRPDEMLVNCVMRNCLTESNQGDGYEFYIKALNQDSAPVSIRLENCRSVGDRTSLRFSTGNGPLRPAVKGSAEFIDCRFERGRAGGVHIGEKPADGCRLRFVRCVIDSPAADNPQQAPIQFSSSAGNTESVGGVVFDDCRVLDTVERRPLGYIDLGGGLRLKQVTGQLTVIRQGAQTPYVLNQELIDRWMPFQAFEEIPRFETRGVEYAPLSSAEDAHYCPCQCRQRGRAVHLVWAAAGTRVEFAVAILPVGNYAIRPAPVEVIAPSGRKQRLGTASSREEQPFSFVASESGAYQIVCQAGSHTARVTSRSQPLCAYAETSMFHFLGTTGEFYFRVPAGVSKFAVKVMGGNSAELVRAALCSPDGKVVAEEDDIAQACQLLGERKDASDGEVWRLRLRRPTHGVLEDFYVQLQGVPPLLASCKDSLLAVSSSRTGRNPTALLQHFEYVANFHPTIDRQTPRGLRGANGNHYSVSSASVPVPGPHVK